MRAGWDGERTACGGLRGIASGWARSCFAREVSQQDRLNSSRCGSGWGSALALHRAEHEFDDPARRVHGEQWSSTETAAQPRSQLEVAWEHGWSRCRGSDAPGGCSDTKAQRACGERSETTTVPLEAAGRARGDKQGREQLQRRVAGSGPIRRGFGRVGRGVPQTARWMDVFSSRRHTWPLAAMPARAIQIEHGNRAFQKAGVGRLLRTWYCQGLIFAARSQRRMVEARGWRRSRAWAAVTNSVLDQRESGRSESRGRVHARAVTCARWTEGKKRGFPGRGASPRRGPSRARARHLRTVRSVQPTAARSSHCSTRDAHRPEQNLRSDHLGVRRGAPPTGAARGVFLRVQWRCLGLGPRTLVPVRPRIGFLVAHAQ